MWVTAELVFGLLKLSSRHSKKYTFFKTLNSLQSDNKVIKYRDCWISSWKSDLVFYLAWYYIEIFSKITHYAILSKQNKVKSSLWSREVLGKLIIINVPCYLFDLYCYMLVYIWNFLWKTSFKASRAIFFIDPM